jgi:hypothetical protein
MGISGSTGADGIFRLRCDQCNSGKVVSEGFDRDKLGAPVLLFLCWTCGPGQVRLKPAAWENVLVSDGVLAARPVAAELGRPGKGSLGL